MCGIAGSVALEDGLPAPELDDLVAMISAVRHRGPDEHGLYRDQKAGLGHARLSIIDVESGHQPMPNEDETLWVVFNGEIFNHVELRVELEALGHRFRTRSDTEVIVHAWEAWGERAFGRFNGQFAIALWDAGTETLVLSRDRLGIRPLFMCEHGGRLWFASEVKALFAGDPTIPREFHPDGLAEAFTFWATSSPQTVFAGVTELVPGHVRTISRGRSTERAYWEPRYPQDGHGGFEGTLEDATSMVRAQLDEAVRLRMVRSDVPVGCYVSGGLDSSLLATLAHGSHQDQLQTFAIRFEDPEFDESPFQRSVAATIDSDHHELTVTRRQIAEAFPEVVYHAEQPLLRTAPAPLFLLSRMVHEAGIKVVLTGEGADEVFAGYDLFREAKVRRFWGRRPDSEVRPLLLERLYPYIARSPVAQRSLAREYFGRDRQDWQEPGFGHRPRWQATAALQRLFRPELRDAASVDVVERMLASLPPEFATWSYLAQDQYLETRTLLGGYLLSSQGDRMLMANSVEGRFPYLDPHVVELANALPARYKLRGLEEKLVLKRVARGLVPAPVLQRPKQPYRAPDAAVFVGSDAPAWVSDIMSDSAVMAAGVFDPDAVGRLWRKCLHHPPGQPFSNTDNMALVGVLSTGLLGERLVRSTPTRDPSITLDIRIDRIEGRSPTTLGASSQALGDRPR